MANYAIFRLAKRRNDGAAAMARHALREARVHNADPTLAGENSVLAGPATADGVMQELRAKLPERRRRDAVTCLDLFVGASPEAMTAMDRKAQDTYFRCALNWISEQFGGRANVISAVVHRDEATPHLQVLLVPLLDGKLNAKVLVGDRKRLQALQDSFAELVGKPAGLRRGERASGAKHTSIRAFYGAVKAAGTRDALPARVPVPPALPKPGVLASKATKAAFEARELERKEAQAANAARQREIERLARVGLASHGRAARALPEARSELEAAQAATQRERDAEQEARRLHRIHQREVAELAERRERLAAEVEALEQRSTQLKEQQALSTKARRPGN